MHTELKGRFRRPITISVSSLSRLGVSLENIRAERFRLFASERDESIKEIEALWRRENMLEVGETPSFEASMAEVSAHYDKVRERAEQDRTAQKLDELARLKIGLNYRSGTSYDLNDLSQLQKVLEDEPGTVESISVSQGSLFKDFFTIRFYDSWTTCSYSIAGDKSVAESARLSLSAFLDSAAPDHPYLHHRFLQGLVAVILAGITANYVTLKLLADVLGNMKKSVSSTSTVVSNVLLVGLLFLLTWLMERAFPKLQVEFGRHWRRVKARRTIMMVVLTALLIPLALQLIP
jgi:hypothetical protein